MLGAAHAPAPSHAASGSSVEPSHRAARHVTSAPALRWQLARATPSQASAAHGVSAVPDAQAVFVDRGLPTTGEHLPARPITSQASHCPSQAASQHTPSTQSPVAHSAPSAQAMPACFTHLPSLPLAPQVAPGPQLPTPQHTPSVQKPVAHASGVVHGAPRPGAGTQALLTHRCPAAQSALVPHALLHEFAAQP